MTTRERCPAPEADGRWCQYTGSNGGPYICDFCGGQLDDTSGSPRRDEAPETGNARRCRHCGDPSHNGTDEHACCARLWNGRHCLSCEASKRYWRELRERWEHGRSRRRKPTKKKGNQHG